MAAAAVAKESKKVLYDLVVIGGGSGGMAAAKEARKLNKNLKVAIFDFVKPSPMGTKWGLGGTCVNVGCIPKKLMHYTGLLGHSFESARELGWNVPEKPELKWESMATSVQDYIGSLNWAYKKQLNGAGVKYFRSYARLAGNNTVEYEEKNEIKQIEAKNILIATGGRPNMGDFPGKEVCISSDDLFWLKKSPGKTLVIGAGYIAVECAGFLHEIKTGDISLMVRSKVLRSFDEQCAAQIGEVMERRGLRFIMPANPISFKKLNVPKVPEGGKLISQGPRKGQYELPAKDGQSLYFHPSGATEVYDNKTQETSWQVPEGPVEVSYKIQGDETIHKEVYDTVLLAIGRNACVNGIGLEKAGVSLNQGKILVDEMERTTVENVYAIGDVSTGIKKHGFAVGAAVVVVNKETGVITKEEKGNFTVRLTSGKDKGKVVTCGKEKLTFQSIDRPELTPAAIRGGTWLARRLFGKLTQAVNYEWIPTTVFSTPEYGTAGLTTEAAEKEPAEGGVGKDNVEVWYSRYGPIEQTPTHPHYIKPRSTTMLGKNLWARQYAEKNKIYWPDAGFDDGDYSSVFYNDGKKEVAATVTEKYQNDSGAWVYDLEIEGGGEAKGVSGLQLELRGDEALAFRFDRYVKSDHLAKLVCHKKTGKILGFHFIGANAGEVTQGFALACMLGATKEQFDNIVGIHPTAAEEFAVLDVNRSSGENFLKQEGCGGGSC